MRSMLISIIDPHNDLQPWQLWKNFHAHSSRPTKSSILTFEPSCNPPPPGWFPSFYEGSNICQTFFVTHAMTFINSSVHISTGNYICSVRPCIYYIWFQLWERYAVCTAGYTVCCIVFHSFIQRFWKFIYQDAWMRDDVPLCIIHAACIVTSWWCIDKGGAALGDFQAHMYIQLMRGPRCSIPFV